MATRGHEADSSSGRRRFVLDPPHHGKLLRSRGCLAHAVDGAGHVPLTKVKREASQAINEGDVDQAVGLMQAQATSVSDFLVGIDDSSLKTEPIRDRLTEEAVQLQRLATGAQEHDRKLAMKSMAEDINLQSRGRDDKERRMRNRSKRDC